MSILLSLRRDFKIQQFQKKKNFQCISRIIFKELNKGFTLFGVINHPMLKYQIEAFGVRFQNATQEC